MANIKPIQDKQCERIQCRLTIAEKNILQKKADAVGKPIGRYIVELGLADAVEVLPTELSHWGLEQRLGLSRNILRDLHEEAAHIRTGDKPEDVEAEKLDLDRNYRLAEMLSASDPDNLRWYAVRSYDSSVSAVADKISWVTTKPLPANKAIAKGKKLANYLLAVLDGEQPELTPDLIAIYPSLAKERVSG